MDEQQIVDWIAGVFAPRSFWLASGVSVSVAEQASETLIWEVFRGHLLDRRQTRNERTFRSWHLFVGDPQLPTNVAEDAPVVSLRWDRETHELFVTRALLTRGWDVVETRPGYLESRPVQRWTSELVATLDFREPWRIEMSEDARREELTTVIAQAWAGVSRLPITSVEAPLPTFSLGRSGYDAAPDSTMSAGRDKPCSPDDLLRKAWCDPESRGARSRLEFALRALSPSDVSRVVAELPFSPELTEARLQLLRSLFHGASLSPLTRFTENVVTFLGACESNGKLSPESVVDLLAHFARHLVRHLTAYDLVKFHSFGANYPDAIWLDQLLTALLERAVRGPRLFLDSDGVGEGDSERIAKRLRRRAIRQAWLVRRAYEGHRVPDAPTSQGEHARVLPGVEHVVPEEQITQPATRRKQLFQDRPSRSLLVEAVESVWRAALADLGDERELRELGAATFLDRPFGIFKPNGAVDRTPLLAYEAFSQSIARQRLMELEEAVGDYLPAERWNAFRQELDRTPPTGASVEHLPGTSRQGVIMLEDARQASSDFVVRRTARSSLQALAESPVVWSEEQRRTIRRWSDAATGGLLIRVASATAVGQGYPWLEWRDATGILRGAIQIVAGSMTGYGEAWGVEFPLAQFQVESFD